MKQEISYTTNNSCITTNNLKTFFLNISGNTLQCIYKIYLQKQVNLEKIKTTFFHLW